jgi:hypothetical protein
MTICDGITYSTEHSLSHDWVARRISRLVKRDWLKMTGSVGSDSVCGCRRYGR